MFIKKGFRFVEPSLAHFHSKLWKNADKSKKKFSSKIQYGHQKLVLLLTFFCAFF
jgi:hypothetical protein